MCIDCECRMVAVWVLSSYDGQSGQRIETYSMSHKVCICFVVFCFVVIMISAHISFSLYFSSYSSGLTHCHCAIICYFLYDLSLENDVCYVRWASLYISFSHMLQDDIMTWESFLQYWPIVRGINQSLVDSPHRVQQWGTLMFSLFSPYKKREVFWFCFSLIKTI